jgi:hypothetical protein
MNRLGQTALAPVILDSRQPIPTRVTRVPMARDLDRPARELTASPYSHGIQYP